MQSPWIILTSPESETRSPTRDAFERTARFLFQQPGTKDLADYLVEHGVAWLRYGFDDGPMHVLEVTCGGLATFESWADQDFNTQLGEPVTMRVSQEDAVELWGLLASGKIEALQAAFSGEA